MRLIYEINTRCWLRELSEQERSRVTLANVPEREFESWRRLGFTDLWLMGVWRSGPRSRAEALAIQDLRQSPEGTVPAADIVGSPYAIAGYDLSESVGDAAGLALFRERLHRIGVRLVLDFIPNHVGLDHPWLVDRPDLFVQASPEQPGGFEQETCSGRRWIAHGKDPYFPPWSDTAQLDYRNPATRAAMRDELVRVAALCDGVRCDMAMLVLNDVFQRQWNGSPVASGAVCPESEFWEEAIPAVRSRHPDFTFIAEVYWGLQPRLQALGFDYTYHKELYDDLIRRDARAVVSRLRQAGSRFLERSVHFLENHDEPRIASLLPLREHRAAAMILLGLPGMRLLHDGQLTGGRHKVPVQHGCRPRETEDADVTGWYRQLLEAVRRMEVGRGAFDLPEVRLLNGTGAGEVVAFRWRQGEGMATFVMVNFSDRAVQCRMMPQEPALRRWRLLETWGLRSGLEAAIETETGELSFSVEPFGFGVFQCEPMPHV